MYNELMANVVLVGFLQALGVAAYITVVAVFMQNAIKWFGPLNNFLGPIIMLTLLSVSVLICGFIALGYPIKVFWIKKQPKKAMKIVGYTTAFLFVFLALVVACLSLSR